MFPAIFFLILTKYYGKMKETTCFDNLFGTNDCAKKKDCLAAVLLSKFVFVCLRKNQFAEQSPDEE